MKRDMGGAAAVLAAFQAAVQVGKGAYALHAVLCLAENSVDAAATRPDDVLTLYSGKTVRVFRKHIHDAFDEQRRLRQRDSAMQTCHSFIVNS